MEKYKFIGDPMLYNMDSKFELTPSMILYGGFRAKNWDYNVSDFAKYFPDEWELVEEAKADRFNTGKPVYSLISLKELEPMAKVLEFGAKKYDRDNWKKGLKFSEILDSMLRHIAAIQSGEEIDPESGLSHIGHIQCNALFLGGKNNEIDIKFKDKKDE